MTRTILAAGLLVTGCASQQTLQFGEALESQFGREVAVTGILLGLDRSADLCPPGVTEDVVGCIGLVGGSMGNPSMAALHAKCATVRGVLAPALSTREERGVGLRARMQVVSVAPCHGR